MAEGTSTFMGLAPALLGESEIQQQTAATDILTITGATSQSGDFLVLQNSTGTELFVISSSGAITASYGAAYSGVVTGSFSATTTEYSIGVTVSSTGALAQGATLVNAFQVTASSKAVINGVLAYDCGGDGSVATANAFLLVTGSKAPSYLFSVGATAPGVAAAGNNGFFEASKTFATFPTSAVAFAGIKVLAGSKAYYMIAYPDTTFT